jgi:hypothetical protein
VTTWSITVLGAVPAAVERSRIASPADALSRFRAVWRTLSVSPPLKSLLRDSETPFAKAAAYVDRCVPRASRVFVLGNLPELYFFAQRPFAGGHAWIIPGYASTNDEQQLIIDRLRAFDVPLILTEPDPLFTDEYVPDFSLLVPYLTSRYDVVGSIAIGDTSTMRVHLLEGAAWRDRDEPTGLPCAPSSSLTSTR